MKMPRTALLALTTTALLAGVTFARPSWAAELGLDFWTLPRLHAEINAHRQRAAELKRQDEAVLLRLWTKEAAIEELVASEIELREASLQFLAVNRRSALGVTGLRFHYRGANDEERATRQVIAFVRAREPKDPRVTAELLSRLESETERLR